MRLHHLYKNGLMKNSFLIKNLDFMLRLVTVSYLLSIHQVVSYKGISYELIILVDHLDVIKFQHEESLYISLPVQFRPI